MARTKTSKAWMREHVTDPFVRKAKQAGLRSRAAYKLDEILGKDNLLRSGMTVIDLGSAPGGWSQIMAPRVGKAGAVIAVDMLEMASIPGVIFLQGDFSDDMTLRRMESALNGKRVDLVVSDMSPNISGIAMVDQARSVHLGELALEFSRKWLKPGGNLLVKVFEGAGLAEFRRELASHFASVAVRKPEASRDRSNELYLLARRKKPENAADKAASAGLTD
ncbi:MAG: RlmE family RNA methyltransferase [Burkholderiales bacterium]